MLSPFPAGRRVLAITVVLGLVVAAAGETIGRGARWPLRAAVGVGVMVAGIDLLDARVEPALARAAIAIGERQPGRGYFVGHWGFQYECERRGLLPWLPMRTQLRTGDWVLVPLAPDEYGFYRPDRSGIAFDGRDCRLIGEVVWDDGLAAQTLPELYGGRCPLKSRYHPRLRVAVYAR